jgi:hypothetical protein
MAPSSPPRGPGRRALSYPLLASELARLQATTQPPPWLSPRALAAVTRARALVLADLQRAADAAPSLHALAQTLGVSDTTVDGWVAAGLVTRAK